MITISLGKVKIHLAKLLERVAKGEEMIIIDRGKPIVKIVPIIETALNGLPPV